MLTASQLFGLGNAVPVIGIYFGAADLLDRAQRGAPAVVARARELLATFDARKPGVIANVRRVEGLLAALGASAGAPPRVPAELAPWSRRVLEAVEGRLQPDHVGLATFHLVGRLCGDALAALDLAGYALALADAAPGETWLEAELAQARAELARLARSLRGAAGVVPSPAATAELTGIADELDDAPLASLAETQAALKRCADRVARVEPLLAA